MKDTGQAADTKILIVDDDPMILQELMVQLEPLGSRIYAANSGAKALELLQKNRPDIILMDIHMPEMSGIDTCKAIKDNSELEPIPILFLTASSSDVKAAFEVGAVDYILKPVQQEELFARVNAHLKISLLMRSLAIANEQLMTLNASLEERVVDRTKEVVTANKNLRQEINERRHLEDRLAYISKFDFVTRMFNRSSMEEKLGESLMSTSNEQTEHLYFLYLDLDQFRIVNDTCSHLAGDELLRQLADMLKSSVDNDDIVARMGGDEFAILFQSANLEDADEKTKKLKTTIEDFAFTWEGNVFHLGVSMGLIELDSSFYDVEQVIAIAERTCFEVKARGGREISIYNKTKDHIDNITEQLHWIPIIQQAIKEDRFYLIGQSIVCLNDESCKKFEVLLRLETEDNEELPPGHFIPIAERYHLITDIDKWVIQEVLKHRHLLENNIELSINISGESFVKASFVDFVEEQVKQCGEHANKIWFEITETSAISHVEATQNFIERIGAYGCRFSLDDFGTGSSSYGQLKALSINQIKIDGVFVRGLEHEKINRMMIDSIKSIANEMDIEVVAECVETKEALDTLKEIGVDYVQGFYFDKGDRLSNK